MSAKKSTLASMIISLAIGLILGVVILALAGLVDVSFIIKWGLIITGIIIIISNIPSLVTGILNVRSVGGVVSLIMSIFGIVLGTTMIFLQNEILTAIVAIYLIAFPIVEIVLSKDWKNKIKSEWIKILIGVLLIAFLPALLGVADQIVYILMLVAGWATIGVSTLLFVISLVAFLLNNNKTSEEFVETTAEESKEN